MGEGKGAARRFVGWLTGDRRVEAEGRIEEARGEVPEDERLVEDVKEDVKRDHGDFGRPGHPVESSDR